MVNQRKIKRMDFCQNSFAKINLFLDILSRYTNGYHEIKTIFVEIDLCDEIKFFLTNKQEIRILSNIDSLNNNENLIYKIAIFIKDRYSVKKGVEIDLKKNIPISAGLGGGSSNAAVTIQALNVLWELNLSIEEKHEIASKFGSDINFFLIGGSALGVGRGDQIQPIEDLFFENILLVNPGFGISSKEAYELVNITEPNMNWKALIQEKEIKYCFNKLEENIRIKYPIVSEMIEELKDYKAKKAIMSGSGSTVIGFFDDRENCKEAYNHFKKKGLWSYITSTRRRQKE